jgi:PAS domain S-box-containing protein
MSGLLRKIESGEIKVPSLPTVASKIIELTVDEDISIKKISEIIEKSQSIVVKLLKLANSTFYRGAKEIKTIQGAVTRFGLDMVKNTILNISLLDVFKGGKESSKMQKKVWEESFTMAVCARSLAIKTGHQNPEEAFTIGLVTHIGMMIMLTVVGKDYLELLSEKFYHSKNLKILEREAYQTSHVEVGYLVLTRWNFPKIINEVVKHHDSREILSSPNKRLVELIKIIQVAEKIAGFFVSENPILNQDIVTLCKLFFDMNEKAVEEFAHHIPEEVNEAASLLSMDRVLDTSYDQIYKSAIGRLADLNLKYDELNKNLIKSETDRNGAEEALRESEERYRAVATSTSDIISETSPDGRLSYVSPNVKEVLGYEASELVDRGLMELIHPDDAPAFLKDPQKSFQLLKQQKFVYRFKHRNGDWRWLETAGTEYKTRAGETRALAISRDITERKRAEQEKIQLGKMGALGTLTAGVAHELNNPMMGMLNFIQYCLKHTSEDDKKFTVLEDAERETKRCIDIVQNLLTFSRVEKEEEKKFQKESITVVFDRVFRLLSYRIEKENILLTQQYSEDTPEIWMKVSNIQQVFLNLVGNAMDSLKDSKKKELHVEVRPEGKFVLVAISDSGCGISPGNLENIFDPFFTTKPQGQGTGLGLSVTHGIVKLHRGRITCKSEVGIGTKFYIVFPIERRAKAKA